ncbi:DNA polymerase III epsilon subunit [Winogradskyella psychrotolerans RS-3]|uniref:Excinuclease cho n=1 Tax=Winogradskyella psychrotolerans RS-3 TaxID=641526 RepID=S7VL00_9FLAO|nr:DNA polymerase III epsilon subunit [Winogradskyella psychrotolerans RS-3]
MELSQQLIPDMASYSLGKLTRALGIPMSDRHRANGDAMATVKLFKMLLNKDLDKVIVKDAIKIEKKSNIATNLKDIIEELPSDTGVYYIHNANGEIIYIGKSNNIRKRIIQHFTGTNSKSKKIQKLVSTVTYEKTGSELAALLKESAEIKANKPIFNRALRRTVFTHALYSSTDKNGYVNLFIDKSNREDNPITTFSNRASAKHFMFKAAEDFNLCQKLTDLYDTKTSCFKYEVKECLGACINEEPIEYYNERVDTLIEKFSYANKDMLIIDKGRSIEEKSVFLIENGIFKGMGFFDLNHQINNRAILASLITPMENNRDTQHIIQSYMRRNKRLKIIDLN